MVTFFHWAPLQLLQPQFYMKSPLGLRHTRFMRQELRLGRHWMVLCKVDARTVGLCGWRRNRDMSSSPDVGVVSPTVTHVFQLEKIIARRVPYKPHSNNNGVENELEMTIGSCDACWGRSPRVPPPSAPGHWLTHWSARGDIGFIVRSSFRAKHHVVVQYMARWMKCPLPSPHNPLPIPQPPPPPPTPLPIPQPLPHSLTPHG